MDEPSGEMAMVAAPVTRGAVSGRLIPKHMTGTAGALRHGPQASTTAARASTAATAGQRRARRRGEEAAAGAACSGYRTVIVRVARWRVDSRFTRRSSFATSATD